jgi:hypothetical protein
VLICPAVEGVVGRKRQVGETGRAESRRYLEGDKLKIPAEAANNTTGRERLTACRKLGSSLPMPLTYHPRRRASSSSQMLVVLLHGRVWTASGHGQHPLDAVWWHDSSTTAHCGRYQLIRTVCRIQLLYQPCAACERLAISYLASKLGVSKPYIGHDSSISFHHDNYSSPYSAYPAMLPRPPSACLSSLSDTIHGSVPVVPCAKAAVPCHQSCLPAHDENIMHANDMT